MEYDNFMFDEAFEFHDRNREEIAASKSNHEGDEVHTMDECRLPPLGACSSDLENGSPIPTSLDDDIARKLQQEHNQLNTSLLALTSHFAQVQFRLKQIIHGPKEDQEVMLAELEDFAFAGCPDVAGPLQDEGHGGNCQHCVCQSAIAQYESRVAEERERGKRLDSHLKQMISELEVTQKEKPPTSHKGSFLKRKGYQKTKLKEISDTYTFDAAERVVSDEEEEENVVPEEDLKKYIDTKMAKLINPKKAKEDVISQVSKQIHSMEKFVSFLQSYESSVETDHETANNEIKRSIPSRNTATKANEKPQEKKTELPAPHTKILKLTEEKRKKMQEASIAVMKKGMTVLQIFAISQFGCSARHFREYMIRKSEQATTSSTGYLKPYETFRASVDRLIMLHTKLVDVGGLTPDSEDELNLPISSTDKRASWSRKRSESTSSSFERYNRRSSTLTSQLSNSSTTLPERPHASAIQEDLIRLVRGEFATSLKDLVQHGLCQSFQSSNLSTKALVGCMSSHTVQGYGLHIWELFDKFYQLKRGDTFNRQPSNMLSEAFAMDIGCTQQNPKQALLTVLHRIKKTHEPRKRSYDAMYKALVSASLNRGRLAQWIRLVIRCPELVDRHFERWSYVIRTGFDDVLTSLEKLSSLTFFLPEDLAIRHLLKNTNEFGDA